MAKADFNEGRRYALQTLEGLIQMPDATVCQAVQNLADAAHDRLGQWVNPDYQLGVLSIVEVVK